MRGGLKPTGRFFNCQCISWNIRRAVFLLTFQQLRDKAASETGILFDQLFDKMGNRPRSTVCLRD
jgi:hypothetical protein